MIFFVSLQANSVNYDSGMPRYFIEMAYKGTHYHGWQIQPNAPSIQAYVEDALSKLIRNETVNIVGAGRTDAGVHASYFVAHFDAAKPVEDAGHFIHRINRILPNDIVVYSIQEVDDELHSRFSAISRTYHYYIQLTRNPFSREFVYKPYYAPDFEKMNEAANLLLNYTDFTSFSKLHTDVKTNNCKVTQAQWVKQGNTWVFIIRADRFLRNMVRAVVGTLLDVGRGKLTLDEFKAIIEAKDRSKAGTSAPAQGLFLVQIEYPQASFSPQVQSEKIFSVRS
jgi:tRNA pseudouridine38-40 synthase